MAARWMFLLAGLLTPPLLQAQTVESIEVGSRTIGDQAFLGGRAEGDAVTLTGRLNLPEGAGPHPAVVLLHGTDGKRSGAAFGWERFLPGVGIASLNLDSYSGRGLTKVSEDQNAFGQFTQVYDAYRAVETLAGDPRIDPERIAVMGFSRGGNAALFSAMTRFQDAFGPERGRIAAHLPFYPACNFELTGGLDVGPAPIRAFHGGADDWTPAEPCRAYVERLAAAGHDAAITIYPDALHAFDNEYAEAGVAGGAQTSRNCMRVEQEGHLVNPDTGQPFTYADACVGTSPHFGHDAAATEAAREAVTAALKAAFGLR